jgi:AcrR family transcriptional regulator
VATRTATEPAPLRKRRPERVEEIVDAAIRLFGARGYHSTSLDDVAREVGLATPSLYRHVRSKLEILEMCLERASEPLLSRVAEIAHSGAAPKQMLADLVDNLIEVVVGHPGMATVLVREHHNLLPEARAFYERSQRLHVEEWVHVLLRVRPGLGDGEARLMVCATLALLHGSTDFVGDVPATQARATLHQMAMSALLGTTGTTGTTGSGTSTPDPPA